MSISSLVNSLKMEFEKEIESLFIGSVRHGTFELSDIKVKKEFRGQGIGTKIMRKICSYADANELKIILSPHEKNRGKLLDFYGDIGFLLNKGRNKDYRFMSMMIRYPKGLTKSEYLKKYGCEEG